ncbi:SH3 domain-containing protein [bacterium]|nr:SH3 domain-containing protein [bacterium]
MVREAPKVQTWTLFLVLGMLMFFIAACGGPPSAAAPTALPPGERVDQATPIPIVPTQAPANTAMSTPDDTSTESDTVQALLATQIAARSEPTATPLATQASAAAESAVRRAIADMPLTNPTSLGIVGGAGIGFYSAPGGGFILDLPAGTTLTVTGRSADGNWYAAYLEDGRAGWVNIGAVQIFGDPGALEIVNESFSPAIVATLIAEAQRPVTPIATRVPPVLPTAAVGDGVSPEQTPLPPVVESVATPVVEAISGPSVTVIVEGANVRAGPGTDFAIVGALTQGAQAAVLGRNDAADWLRIQTPQGEGWIFTPLVEVSVPVAELPISTETPQPPQEPATPPEPETEATQTQAQAAPATGLAGQLVFQEQNAGTIYRYDLASGSLQRLTSGTDPAISPDGSTVAFVRGGGENGVYLINSDGGNERRIYVGNNPRGPKWSPDGQFVVFSHITGEVTCYDVGFICLADPPPPQFNARQVTRPKRNLARVDFNGNNYRDIPSLNSAAAPDWHPWGIVYQSDAGLQITQDSTDAQTQPLINEFHFQDPDWQPGAGRVVFHSQEGTHWEIFAANADGSSVGALTRPPIGEQPNNVAPAWSPDGSWIVFLSNRGGSWGLWVMDSGGGNLLQLPVDLPIDYAFQAEQAVDWGP